MATDQAAMTQAIAKVAVEATKRAVQAMAANTALVLEVSQQTQDSN